MASLLSHSHSRCLSVSFAPCQRITFFLSRLPSWVLWCYFSSLTSLPTTAAHNKHGRPVCPSLPSYSFLHTPVYFVCFVFLDRKTVVGNGMSKKKKKKEHTVSPYPIRSLVQIAPLLTNESLEGCTQQSLSSGAITASVSSKELGGTITITEGLLPAWIALDIRKPAVY